MNNDSDAYAGLRRDMMASLRATHPNWTEDVFDQYEARFAELLRALSARRKQHHPKSTLQMM